MLELKRADYPGDFHGFNLKEGFYYGNDTSTGQYIATSGWVVNNFVAVYFLTEDKWTMTWVDIDETKWDIRNLPEVNIHEKLKFTEWLEDVHGINWNEFDEIYSDSMARQIEDEYESYLYDGLPRFTHPFIERI